MSNSISKCEYVVFRFSSIFLRMLATRKSLVIAMYFAGITSPTIPGGCTKYIQAPDVCWNKPFKANGTEMYDQWLSEEGLNLETSAGNLTPPRTN